MIHYANLTRGLLCPHLPGERVHYVRIQSTWCEQKRWGDILVGVGPDMLYRLAVGEAVMVHDLSERDRVSRALWQGLAWVRFACTLAWCDKELPTLSRNGMDVTAYWASAWRALNGRERRAITYYRAHHTGGPVDLIGCREVSP